ncbi:MAG: ATP-binding cassette domain-containing protein [Lachnospiraceae bacterium]|nr:ATP-binding cassette domain-containing protein [Lachnospiraceae bacterium]
MEKLIILENLTKKYGDKCVLDHISWDFFKGESVAFTGHNGSGKSTLLKLMAGLITKSSGNVIYHGKLRMGYVPEKFPGMDITMNRYLKCIAGMEGINPKIADELMRDFFLESMKDVSMKDLSKGSLQKVGVIQALMTPADVLLFDEPLSGQDAESQEVFIRKSNELRDKGVTVFMSCHEKRLVEELCDKEYVIDNGILNEKRGDGENPVRILIEKNIALSPRADMKDTGSRYLLYVDRKDLKENVLRLYSEGWEISGIEECI